MCAEPIESRSELTRFFAEAFHPPSEWRVGLEFEKLGVDPRTGRALPFSGPGGVESLLVRLAERHGWTPVVDHGRVLGLARGESRITLEPGAQLELSDAPRATLHEIHRHMEEHIREITSVADPQEAAWLGLGCHPVSEWPDIEMIPKRRYDIMHAYMPERGSHGRAMMRETAAMQLNLDYRDEQDAMEKYRVSMAVSPLFTALFANSCISRGQPNGLLTRRAYIWQHTDPERCGFIERLYHEDAGFEDYVDYALDVPMYCLVRGELWIDLGGRITFRELLERGYEGYRAEWDDWLLHLSTIFTEARFKPYLEVRGADCPPPDMVMVFPALMKGILYDRQARQEAWEIVRPWSTLLRQVLFLKISREGPRARIQGVPIRDRIVEIVRVCREGLQRQAQKNEDGRDESLYLEPLEERMERGWECPAREVLDLWRGPWRHRVDKLIAFARF